MVAGRPSVVVVTNFPSPYQVELFEHIHLSASVDLSVIYVSRIEEDRKWQPKPFKHRALFIEDHDIPAAEIWIRSADLVVFSWYRDSRVLDLISLRARASMPWCYWAERPGFTFKGFIGRTYRRTKLHHLLNQTHVPIWGIGTWAVEGFRREFGGRRQYYNVPYSQSLSRFYEIGRCRAQPEKICNILYSGALIERKGIDVLCEAYLRIANEFPDTQLTIMGDGPLMNKLKRMAGTSLQIEFLGFRDWDVLHNTYAAADLLCAPSKYDGWGLTVIEGLSSGLPVLATEQMGSARDAISEGQNGWLVPWPDADALERSLRKALNLSAAQLSAMSAHAQASARAYDLEEGASRFVSATEITLSNWPK